MANYQGKLFIVSAPSGAGKTTLVNEVINRIGDQCALKRVVTYTSKSPRYDEHDGYEYHFISASVFKQKIKKDFFLEWSRTYGNYYGTPRTIVQELRQGISYVLVIDRNGMQQIIKQLTGVVLIWVTVESLKILKQRLAQRGDAPEHIKKRLALAEAEMKEESAKPLYQYHLLNDNFFRTVRELEIIFMRELGQ